MKKPLCYDPNWKDASRLRWEDATWGYPWALAQLDLNSPGKTIICGHRPASEFHRILEDRESDDIYYGEKVIGIDGHTVSTGKCNVLIIEDGQIAK